MSNEAMDRRDFIKLTAAAMLTVFSDEELSASRLYQTPRMMHFDAERRKAD